MTTIIDKIISDHSRHLAFSKICMHGVWWFSYFWVSLGYFAVNLSGGQPKMY